MQLLEIIAQEYSKHVKVEIRSYNEFTDYVNGRTSKDSVVEGLLKTDITRRYVMFLEWCKQTKDGKVDKLDLTASKESLNKTKEKVKNEIVKLLIEDKIAHEIYLNFLSYHRAQNKMEQMEQMKLYRSIIS